MGRLRRSDTARYQSATPQPVIVTTARRAGGRFYGGAGAEALARFVLKLPARR